MYRYKYKYNDKPRASEKISITPVGARTARIFSDFQSAKADNDYSKEKEKKKDVEAV